MNKLVFFITAMALFTINSFAISGSSGESTAEKAVNAEAAQEILNKMACKNKEPGEQAKDQTSGKMITCPVPENNN